MGTSVHAPGDCYLVHRKKHVTEHAQNNYSKCALCSDVVLLGEQLLMSRVTNCYASCTQVRQSRAVAALRKSCGAHLLEVYTTH